MTKKKKIRRYIVEKSGNKMEKYVEERKETEEEGEGKKKEE